MADTKISALTAATTPLAGTEVLPIVQSSTTKKVAVSDLTAGRSVSAASLSLTTTPLAVTSGGTGLATLAQGDLLYGSASNTLSALAKNTTATRYLSNTGSSNNPAWAQVDLTNGVTGTLPVGNGGTGNTTGAATAVKSNATTGLMEIVGPGAGTTRVMTIPNGNFTAARTDGAQSFTGKQTFNDGTSTTTSEVTDITINAGNAGANYTAKRNGTTGFLEFYGNQSGFNGYLFGGVDRNFLQLANNGDIQALTGNVVISTSGKGIDFSAAGGDTLKYYDEGTWTPTISNQTNCTITNSATKRYTRIGNAVIVNVAFNYTSTGGGIASFEFTLPFTADSAYGISTLGSGYPDALRWIVRSGTTTTMYCKADVASATNHDVNISFAYQMA